jgi:hypothetical protein
MPSSQSHQLRIFLCHSSGDKPAVRQLRHRLQESGYEPWLDEEDLLPGQKWEQEIPKAVRNSDVVLVCLSQESVTKQGYVQKEIKLALDAADQRPDGTIFLIPVRLSDCNIPERLREWQWVDLFEDRGYDRLLHALGSVTSPAQPPRQGSSFLAALFQRKAEPRSASAQHDLFAVDHIRVVIPEIGYSISRVRETSTA